MADTEEQDPQLVAARAFLERLIRSAGWKLQDVDAKLGFNRGWVSRVIHGDIRLSYHHILRILDTIGVDPYLFFSTLHPAPRRARAAPEPGDFFEETRVLAERVLRNLPGASAEDLPAYARTDDDLEARISEAVRAVLSERRGPPVPARK